MKRADSQPRAMPGEAGPFKYPLFWAVNAFFLVALILWLFLDHSWPEWDAAEHIKNAFDYRELLRHPRFWNGDWLHQFLTVNYCYPPTIHIFHGFLKVLFGSGRWVDSLLLVVFAATLNASVYGIGWLLFKNRLAAALSVVFINCYPLAAFYSHANMLDFPHLSMFSLAILGLLWWRERPSMKRAVLCGISLGLACSAKQIGTFYVAGPVAFLLFQLCWQKEFAYARQLICASLIGGMFLLPWIIPNVEGIASYMVRNHDSIGSHASGMFGQSLCMYTAFLPLIMSPFLLAVAVVGAVSNWPKAKLVGPVALGGAVGLILMSWLSFQLPEARYIIPCLLAPALISGYQAAWCLSRKAILLRAAAIVIVGLALTQFICAFYSPHPLSKPEWLSKLPFRLGTPRLLVKCPTASGDPWGQDWVIRTVTQADGAIPSWLQVMPSTGEISVHTLELVARLQGSSVRPTTTRLWTPLGDKFEMDQSSLTNFRWFLLKSGYQGHRFRDEVSRENYLHVEQSVKSGGRFILTGQMTLPDGSFLYLYRQREPAV